LINHLKTFNMAYSNLITKIENDVFYLTINRPAQLNALNRETFAELETAFNEIYVNDSLKAVIITGSGEKAFIAGADIKEFADFSAKEAEELSANGQRIFKIIEQSPVPVIAAINGFALGGGLELAMSCHIRIASANARFSQPEVSLGVTPGYAGTQRLVQLIGKTKALELLMTGDMIKADEALSLGLVNYVVEQDQLLAKAEEITGKLKTRSPFAIKGVIKCVNAFFEEGVNGFSTEVKEFGKCFASQDFKEGTSAFLEKRPARFTGK
jgi:enoyl-CoA hydratase